MILGLVRSCSVPTSEEGWGADRNNGFETYIPIIPRDSGFRKSLREELLEEHT
jgi:hypothetical protein